MLRILLFSLFFYGISYSADSLTVFTLSSRSAIDFTSAGTDERVSSYLVVNPGLTPFTMIIAFGNECNVKHFRQTSIKIPLTKVLVKINGNPEITWNRAGADCTSHFTWSPVVLTGQYQVDILISWTGIPMNIAGTYSESINFWAYK